MHRCWFRLSRRGPLLDVGHLPAELRIAQPSRRTPSSPEHLLSDLLPGKVLPLHEVERRAILHALKVTGGRVGEAARLLEVGRATLYRRIQHLGIDVPDLLGETAGDSDGRVPRLSSAKQT